MCKYFERNGIPCHHQLAVLKTLPNYEAPSHHDVSVVWWSHYIYHREPKNTCCDNKEAGRDSPCHMDDLSLFYKYMEKNDVKGPAYDQKYIDAAPVVSIVPKEFHDSLRVPNCINYDTSNISISEEDRCPFGYIHATNVKQHSNVTFERQMQMHIPSGAKRNRGVWEELSPSFKELVSCLEDERDKSYVNVVKTWLDYQIAQSKTRQFKDEYNDDNNKYVSCNIPSNKRRKTHGTKYKSRT